VEHCPDLDLTSKKQILHIWLNGCKNDSFPINLDDIVSLLTTRRDGVVKMLKRNNLEEGKDYTTCKNPAKIQGGRNKVTYMLSIDCCKKLMMELRTPIGTKIRTYFMYVEKVLEVNKILFDHHKEEHRTLLDRFCDEISKPYLTEKDETYYQKLIESTMVGSRESGIFGMTDFSTLESHIEIKHWKHYKTSLGQLLFYNEQNSKNNLMVYLFGSCPYSENKQKRIVEIFRKHNVQVFAFDDQDMVVKLS
jgi:phage anti-repressor protein